MLVESIRSKADNEPDSRIRRRYKKTVKSFGKRLILNRSVTTGQIEAQLSKEEADKMKPLKTLYEQERYRDEV